VPIYVSHKSVYSTNINHFIWLVYRYTYRSDELSFIGRNLDFCRHTVLNKPRFRKNSVRKLEEFLQLAWIFIHCLPYTILQSKQFSWTLQKWSRISKFVLSCKYHSHFTYTRFLHQTYTPPKFIFQNSSYYSDCSYKLCIVRPAWSMLVQWKRNGLKYFLNSKNSDAFFMYSIHWDLTLERSDSSSIYSPVQWERSAVAMWNNSEYKSVGLCYWTVLVIFFCRL
jgi:hypothetical protein